MLYVTLLNTIVNKPILWSQEKYYFNINYITDGYLGSKGSTVHVFPFIHYDKLYFISIYSRSKP